MNITFRAKFPCERHAKKIKKQYEQYGTIRNELYNMFRTTIFRIRYQIRIVDLYTY